MFHNLKKNTPDIRVDTEQLTEARIKLQIAFRNLKRAMRRFKIAKTNYESITKQTIK